MRTIEDNAFLLLTVAVSLAFAWILLPFYGAVLWGIRSDDQLVTLFASVPLTSERWEPLAEGELVAVSHGQFAARQLVGESPVFYEHPVDPLDRAGPDVAGRAFVTFDGEPAS